MAGGEGVAGEKGIGVAIFGADGFALDEGGGPVGAVDGGHRREAGLEFHEGHDGTGGRRGEIDGLGDGGGACERAEEEQVG